MMVRPHDSASSHRRLTSQLDGSSTHEKTAGRLGGARPARKGVVDQATQTVDLTGMTRRKRRRCCA